MKRSVAMLLCVGFVSMLGACSLLPSQQPTDSGVLRLYPGALRDASQVAILKSAPGTMRRDGPAFVTVELVGIDKKRFRQAGGWGNGSYEVHLTPGTYTLHLRYRALRPNPQDSNQFEVLSIDDDQSFSLIAQPGHVYLLTGSLLEETASTAQWVPVVFDRAQHMGAQPSDKTNRVIQADAAAVSSE